MKIIGIIPARFASTRFPGKPLVMINGKSMIERVYQQALLAKNLNTVIVATDDQRIADHVNSFGGKVLMTSTNHPSGTDRCAEALSRLDESCDVIINIQGDEPFIKPKQIEILAECFLDDNVRIATLIKVIDNSEDLNNPNIPKVIIKENNDAIYFSRQPIPYLKGKDLDSWLEYQIYYKHIGIYGFRASILPVITSLPQGQLEMSESLEQLRWIEAGYSIRTKITAFETIAIDTPEDLIRANQQLT